MLNTGHEQHLLYECRPTLHPQSPPCFHSLYFLACFLSTQTKVRCPAKNVNMGRNKLLSQSMFQLTKLRVFNQTFWLFFVGGGDKKYNVFLTLTKLFLFLNLTKHTHTLKCKDSWNMREVSVYQWFAEMYNSSICSGDWTMNHICNKALLCWSWVVVFLLFHNNYVILKIKYCCVVVVGEIETVFNEYT